MASTIKIQNTKGKTRKPALNVMLCIYFSTPDSTPEHAFKKPEMQRRTQSLMVPGIKHELMMSSSSSNSTEDSFSSEDEHKNVFKGDR